MPALFIGHGSPMNALLENDYTESLKMLNGSLPRPKSIMVISAHWLAKAPFVTCMKNPEQMYDFYGFPPELYQVTYPCPGAPDDAQLAARTTKYLVNCAYDWGLDHASWAVLKHLYPDADIPVFEMSLDMTRNMRDHYELAKHLSQLRRQGVLIIGSGNMVHNLQLIDHETDAPPAQWAVDIDEKLKSLIVKGDHAALVEYRNIGKDISLAVPTNEHYLPMIYVLGLREHDDAVAFIHEGFQNGTISMRSFKIG